MKPRIDMPITPCPHAIAFEPEFASETSALFRLGYDREFVFEDLNERMNARPTPPRIPPPPDMWQLLWQVC